MRLLNIRLVLAVLVLTIRHVRSGPEVTAKAYIYVSINSVAQEMPIVLDLFGKDVPKTVESFKSLCRGFIPTFSLPRDSSIQPGTLVSYVGSPFHRILEGYMMQTGDFDHKDGTGGFSLYGETMRDESKSLPHVTGSVSMANRGKAHTAGSQFFIVLADRLKVHHLDSKHVVFGRVAEKGGLQRKGILRVIEQYGKKETGGRPTGTIVINKCQIVENELGGDQRQLGETLGAHEASLNQGRQKSDQEASPKVESEVKTNERADL